MAGVEGLFGPPGLTPPGPPFGRYPSSANPSSRTISSRRTAPTAKIWLGWKDSNLRMAGSKPAALPLGDTPIESTAISLGLPTLSQSPIFPATASRSVREPKTHQTPPAPRSVFFRRAHSHPAQHTRRHRYRSGVQRRIGITNRAPLRPPDSVAARPVHNHW